MTDEERLERVKELQVLEKELRVNRDFERLISVYTEYNKYYINLIEKH